MDDSWGITEGYEDSMGTWRATAPETGQAILKAMGIHRLEEGRPPESRVWVVPQGARRPVTGRATLRLEDGSSLEIKGAIPRGLPLGYHQLHTAQGDDPVRLIVTPRHCWLPEWLPAWGWATQVYATRSRKSWGIGDLADLRRLARWSVEEFGAGVILLNPLNAASPVVPQEASPYSPSSRRFRNLLYLRVEECPGAGSLGPHLTKLAAAGRSLNQSRGIDRDAVFLLKMEALELLWHRFGGTDAFDTYVARQGLPLEEFATFCVLSEHHGKDWRRWPVPYRNPASPEVRRFISQNKERVRFHQWIQWLLDMQLEQVGTKIALIQDLPIGFDPGGADAWIWQNLLATNTVVGAPPDEYNTEGQDWGLPPFVPHKLRTAGYEPFIQTIRAILQHARGLRVDHIMGLFRLFWIPSGMSPKMGAYVDYPDDDLLGILALESHRAKAAIVGEDLGTVDKRALRELRRRRILSYRLLWFEAKHPKRYPRLALTAVTTHDLPTIAGLWTGSDLRVQKDLGLKPNEKGTLAIRSRLGALTGLSEEAPLKEVIKRTYDVLGQAPSLLLTATLEDAVSVEERPNMPGTTSQRPNWSLALPLPLESLLTHPLATTVGHALQTRWEARSAK